MRYLNNTTPMDAPTNPKPFTTESKSLRVIEFRSSGVKRFKDSNSLTLKLPKLLNCLLIFSLCLCVSVVCCGFVVSGFADEPFKYDSHGRRDPFSPLVTKDGRVIGVQSESPDTPEGMHLEGILFDPSGESTAILNGKIIKKGDRVGDYEVTQISYEEVVLLKDDEQVILRIKREINEK